jgi:hypothetical protein
MQGLLCPDSGRCLHRHMGPCVVGSELARTFLTFAALVGAAMCSAGSLARSRHLHGIFECGSHDRWP